MKIIEIEKLKNNEYIITLESGWLWKKEYKYRGSSTIWRDITTGARPSVFVESYLTDKLVLWKWNRE